MRPRSANSVIHSVGSPRPTASCSASGTISITAASTSARVMGGSPSSGRTSPSTRIDGRLSAVTNRAEAARATARRNRRSTPETRTAVERGGTSMRTVRVICRTGASSDATASSGASVASGTAGTSGTWNATGASTGARAAMTGGSSSTTGSASTGVITSTGAGSGTLTLSTSTTAGAGSTTTAAGGDAAAGTAATAVELHCADGGFQSRCRHRLAPPPR